MMLRLGALLLVIWYCFSVIGFDVHTCRASGKSFVATVVSGLSCADIHPSHTCDHSACHSHHDCCCAHDETQKGLSLEAASCCSDDYQVLALTGTVPEKDQSQQISLMPVCDLTHSCGLPEAFEGYGYRDIYVPDSVPLVSGDAQSLLNIWRI